MTPRELDAEFAERVLGLKVDHPHTAIIVSGVRQELDLWFYHGENGVEIALPHYTRSLDAAWQGVEKRGFGMVMHSDHPENIKAGLLYVAKVNSQGGPLTAADPHRAPGRLGVGHAAHPAEAGVLACLKACVVEP
jgi:hypothetical protein